MGFLKIHPTFFILLYLFNFVKCLESKYNQLKSAFLPKVSEIVQTLFS
jgi:hypothetical protein